MWLIISERGESYLITPKEEHFVSRKGGSLTLNDDQSISRHHAKLLLDNDDPNTNCGIILVDTSSKYGTYVNDGINTADRIPPNEKIILKHDDVVRFGLQWNTWRVVFMPLNVLTSTIKQPEKQQVKSWIGKLGGKIFSNWSPQCTHLTMNQITLTVKVVSALGGCQHIVTPKYWDDLTSSIESKKGTFPDPSEYIPPLNEPTLNENQISFKVNENRSALFKSLLFVATSPRQKSRIEPMVTAAGGKVVTFDNCNLKKESFSKEGIILMQSSPFLSSEEELSQIPSSYQTYTKYLSSKGLRCIPESDIGLSVVYCSCEKFCNPRYSAQSVFENHPAPLQQTESLPILAQDTQENSPVKKSDVVKVINETVMSGISPSTGKDSKRFRVSDNESEVVGSVASKINNKTDNMIADDLIKEKEKLPKILENDVFVCNFEVCKDDQKDNREMENDIGASRNERQSETLSEIIVKSKHTKKRMIPSDDDDDDDFKLPSQKKRTCVSNVKNDKKFKISKDDDDDDAFSLPSERKKTPMPSSRVNDSEEDMFGPQQDCDNPVFKSGNKMPTSVDMFATLRSSSSGRKENDISKPSTSLIVAPKSSVDIFDTSNSFKKFKKSDVDDFDFEFSSSREKHKEDSLEKDKDSIFKTTSSSVCNSVETAMIEDNPLQSSKLSRDIFESSNSRGTKRRTSVEEPPSKKSCLNDDEMKDDEFQRSKSVNNRIRNSPERILSEKEIKQEPVDAMIKDEELHDSTVVIIKSLIVPLKNVTISADQSSKKSKTVNFKKFKKATPIKTPEFIDLVPYNEIHKGNWGNETRMSQPVSSNEEDDDDDGWAFKQSQVMKQNKNKAKKIKL